MNDQNSANFQKVLMTGRVKNLTHWPIPEQVQKYYRQKKMSLQLLARQLEKQQKLNRFLERFLGTSR